VHVHDDLVTDEGIACQREENTLFLALAVTQAFPSLSLLGLRIGFAVFAVL
jgi:hypothetical protein